MNRDIKEHAKGLANPTLELIEAILLKHDEAIIESVYERLKEKDTKIASIHAEIDELETENSLLREILEDSGIDADEMLELKQEKE